MNDTSEITNPGGVKSKRRFIPLLLLGVAAVVFISDQQIKNWVVTHLPEGDTVPVIGDFLQWHFVRNPGAAFSLASGSTWIFTILAVIVVVVILWQIRRLRSLSWALFLGLLLGGVLGNLTDRLTREPGFPVGHVVDFIYTPWMMPAIYNIADIGIVTGMLLFVGITLLGIPIDGSPRQTRKARALAAAETETETETLGSPEAENSGNGTP
nr:signal peptidase II [Leucobacter insecticola]